MCNMNGRSAVFNNKLQFCKTQNSGLRSKEEKPRDPINQPSRCNMQEGLLSVAQTGDSDLLGGRAHLTANWASFICSMLHTGYKVIGYMFAKQSYWYKLHRLLFKFKAILLVQTARVLFKFKAILLVQTAQAFFQTQAPTGFSALSRAFYWVHIDWPAPGHPMRVENPTISRETETQVLAPCRSWPRQPHIIKLFFFSASKTNKKNIRHMNYRHW